MSNDSKLYFEKLYSLTDIQKIIRENGYEDEDNNVSLKDIIDEYRSMQYTHQLYMINLVLNLYVYCINHKIGKKIYIYQYDIEDKGEITINLITSKEEYQLSFSLHACCMDIYETQKKLPKRRKISLKTILFSKRGTQVDFCAVHGGSQEFSKNIIINSKFDEEDIYEIINNIREQIGTRFEHHDYYTNLRAASNIIWYYSQDPISYFFKKILRIIFGRVPVKSNDIVESVVEYFTTINAIEQKQEFQKKTGTIGEIIALLYEIKNDCKVKYVGDNLSNGYDIESDKKCIEVKATNGVSNTFYISLNEVNTLNEKGDNSYLYFIKFDNALMDYTFEIINNEQNVSIITNIRGKELEYDLSKQNKVDKLIKLIKEISKSIEIYVLQNPIQKIGLNTASLKSNGFSISIENYKISWDNNIKNMYYKTF